MDFKTHILSSYDKDIAKKLLSSLNYPRTRALLLNNDKMSDLQFKNMFPNVLPHPLVDHAFLYDKNDYDFGKSFYHLTGTIYISDPSSLVVSYILKANCDDFVLDMCAAPGGKTIQASLHMQNKGVIIANDLSYARALVLSQNVERMGRKNIIVTNNDLMNLSEKYNNMFTKIILDAPCSGSGMFRKDEKMISDWSIEKVKRQANIQKELIELAYNLLMPGGTLLYSTCSYSKEENFEVISYLLKKHLDIHLEELSDLEKYSLTPVKEGITLAPSTFNGEGQYLCKLKKDGNLIKLNHNKKQINLPSLNVDLEGTIIQKNNQIYLSPADINLKDFNILRNGLKVGELNKKTFIPDYHLSHFLPNTASINLSLEETKKYLTGETIQKDYKNGFYPVSYQGINVGFVKSVNGVLKNHLPKGLRGNYGFI